MDDIKIKKQVVEKIKSSSNILITVSKDPSVDALSAALGLTLALDKIEKYATAIFSGEIPSVMDFLQPEKTFEDNTDSLRDFIIALNKEKADHLRFKPEGDYVRIYITPYKTKITPEDLEFSQGDFNVDLVIALGVDDQGHLDSALDNHGQILHDATVITMTVGDQTSSLGGIDWHDPQSGSLSEMAVGLVESLKDDKTTTLLDASVATALLTGIVAETDRFSNQKTTSASLTIAANLMTLGADQQLIASKLNEPEPEPEPVSETKTEEAVADVASEPVGDGQPEPDTGQPEQDILKDGYKIEHEKPSVNAYGLPIEEVAVPETPEPEPAPEPASESLSADTPEVAPASEAESAAVIQPLGVDSSASETEIDPNSVAQSPLITPSRAYMAGSEPDAAYALGDDELTSQQSDEPQGFPGEPSVVPGSGGVNQTPADGGELHGAYAFNDNAGNTATQSPPAEAPIDTTQTVSAYAVPVPEPVQEPVSTPTPTPVPAPEPTPALTPTPVPEPVTPQELGLPMPPPLPDFQQFNAPASTPAPAIPLPPTQQPEILGDILNEPATPAVSAAPAVSEPSVFTPVAQPPATAQQPYDPAQFQIPGQQSV